MEESRHELKAGIHIHFQYQNKMNGWMFNVQHSLYTYTVQETPSKNGAIHTKMLLRSSIKTQDYCQYTYTEVKVISTIL